MKIIVINDTPKQERPRTLEESILHYRDHVDRQLGFRGWNRKSGGRD